MLTGMLLHVIEPARPVDASLDTAQINRAIDQMNNTVVSFLNINNIGISEFSESFGWPPTWDRAAFDPAARPSAA
jgi:hypothetical protein